MDEIKAIEGTYKGYRFRSHLEIRWAVFFDSMGIKFRYEEESYDINGLKYLPDFKLYDYNGSYLWAEVKGVKSSEMLLEKTSDLMKIKAFSRAGYPIVVLPDIPVSVDSWIDSNVTTFEYVNGILSPCAIFKRDVVKKTFSIGSPEKYSQLSRMLTEESLRKARYMSF